MNEEVIAAHMFCSNHKDKLTKDKKCGCFYCLEIFDPSEITDWLDVEDMALCPFCGIDSIIGESSGYPVTKPFLKEMHDYWF